MGWQTRTPFEEEIELTFVDLLDPEFISSLKIEKPSLHVQT